MSIREAAEAAQTQAMEQRREPSPAQKLKRVIDVQTKEFKAVLPKGMDADQFARQVLSAVKTTPKLMDCFSTERGQHSILFAAMQAGTMGLMPNTPAQEAWLLPRRVKVNGNYVDECQLNIGYRGYLKLIRNAGGIETVYAEVVREGDEFEYSRGLKEDVLRHVPSGDEDANLTNAYAVVRYTNGGYQFIVLGKNAIEKRRDKSDSWSNEKARPYSPWTTATDAMWRKSAIRALVPFLELSPEAYSSIDADEKTFKRDEDGEIVTDEPTWIDTIATPVSNDDDVRIDLTGQELAETPKEVEAPIDVIDVVEEPASSDRQWLELLKVLMREQMITGNGRWEKVLEVTGMQPRAWQDITEAMAEETCKALDGSASI
jgi:recombination protein RecT